MGRVEHLPRIGEVADQVVDARMIERHQIEVGDTVATFEQIRDRVTAGLAGTAGEQNAHGFLPRVLLEWS